jgi:PhzF family phenazine biosynthesis protein
LRPSGTAPTAVTLTYRRPAGEVGSELVYRDQDLAVEAGEAAGWSFDADGATFRLVAEAREVRNTLCRAAGAPPRGLPFVANGTQVVTTALYVVDAFSGVPFGGNPAGVCLPPSKPNDAWMASVAAEVNLSETAFCWPEQDGWRLRWFTPAVEVPLCGHATLATAFVLWHEGRTPTQLPITFRTMSGDLTAASVDGHIELDFPAQTATPLDSQQRADAASALGVDVIAAVASDRQVLAEVRTEEEVRSAQPDPQAVGRLGGVGTILTAASSVSAVDYVLRYFAPNAGIQEDPVTGSAQCLAGPYWAQRTGRRQFTACQLSKRGGTLYVGVAGDRVSIAGEAVMVFSGSLREAAAAD